jgi:hypothetical protein
MSKAIPSWRKEEVTTHRMYVLCILFLPCVVGKVQPPDPSLPLVTTDVQNPESKSISSVACDQPQESFISICATGPTDKIKN